MKKAIVLLLAALVLGLLARLSFFTVEEGRSALVIGWQQQLRAVRASPGIHAKLPDPVERVVMVDMRGQQLSVSSDEPEGGAELPALGYDVVWRVSDPALWWKSFGGSDSETARGISKKVSESSRSVLSGLGDADLVRRGDGLIAARVLAEAQKSLLGQGVSLDSVRVSGIRMSQSGLEKAMAGTSKIWSGEISASGRLERESAQALRAQADAKAQQTLESALRQAGDLRAAADAAADRLYGRLDSRPGLSGFSARLAAARAETRRSGRPEPMQTAGAEAGRQGGRPDGSQ
ncbi:SPFH domain-containing protein [Mesosutterella sp. AGMB02718]|uniref:SPFH domain-containing protein n=1 Tax=Mesosutterella faecium TaxID=2925194 RepID=A0ABT7IPL7_9BURK|nr:SPFH domain-containing protein [Mesosutterella sp. AGMB02718]MDL2059241.1 SPFH domain-containing protein [Mesosutterella sp. AGMB02718]